MITRRSHSSPSGSDGNAGLDDCHPYRMAHDQGAGQAAEQRTRVAHGVSRGFGLVEAFSPRGGERRVGRWFSAAPSGA